MTRPCSARLCVFATTTSWWGSAVALEKGFCSSVASSVEIGALLPPWQGATHLRLRAGKLRGQAARWRSSARGWQLKLVPACPSAWSTIFFGGRPLACHLGPGKGKREARSAEAEGVACVLHFPARSGLCHLHCVAAVQPLTTLPAVMVGYVERVHTCAHVVVQSESRVPPRQSRQWL
jgi:hypothetical protein